MRYLFTLALKSIMRAKRRTILTFLMLSLGITVYLLLEGMFAGFDNASYRNMIDFETGEIKIRSRAYDEDYPYDPANYIKDTGTIRKVLTSMKPITGFTERIQFIAEIDNERDSSQVIVIGIDPQSDKKVFSLEKYILTGGLEPEGALIGKALARDMEIGIGDPFFLTFRDSEGMYTSIEKTITGLIATADPRINSGAAFISLAEARQAIGVKGAAEIAVKTDNYQKANEYRDRIKARLPGLLVQSWAELSTDFAALMETKRKGIAFFLLFIVIIALTGIINTLLMSVYEKKREIGTLLALGMEQKEVRNIFIFEGLIIGVLGSLSGLILGTLINLYFIYSGIDYTSFMSGNDMGLNIMGVIKSAWVFPAYYKSFLVCTAASVAASYYPAKKVMKLTPVECLRTL